MYVERLDPSEFPHLDRETLCVLQTDQHNPVFQLISEPRRHRNAAHLPGLRLVDHQPLALNILTRGPTSFTPPQPRFQQEATDEPVWVGQADNAL